MTGTNGNAATILVVDDEDDILDLLTYNLQRDGLRTLTAHDGLDALAGAEVEKVPADACTDGSVLAGLGLVEDGGQRRDGRATCDLCQRVGEDPRLELLALAVLVVEDLRELLRALVKEDPSELRFRAALALLQLGAEDGIELVEKALTEKVVPDPPADGSAPPPAEPTRMPPAATSTPASSSTKAA